MDNFSSQWLESIGKERLAPQFSRHGYSTFDKCAQLNEWDLTVMEITEDADREYLFDWAGDLRGRDETEVVKDLPVSVLHTQLLTTRLSRTALA